MARRRRGRYTGAISYQDRIDECNGARLEGFEPWRIGGVTVGHIRVDRVDWLLRHGDGFAREAPGNQIDGNQFDGDQLDGNQIDGLRPHGIQLEGADAAARSAALATTAARLQQAGRLAAPRGELYAVGRDFAAPALAAIDRSAVEWFGVRPYGVHLNGWMRRGSDLLLWIAERARGRLSYPGRLDNMVAGGQPLGLSLRQNLCKEAWEEAGMPVALARRAVPAGCITYVHEHDAGLKPDTLFCFDLEVPRDFVPRGTDGEVAAFHLLPLPEVLAIVRDTRRFKPNCNLVVLDFALRHGGLDGELDAEARAALAAALRRPLP